MTIALMIVALVGILYCAWTMTKLVKLVKECIGRLEARRW